MPTLPTPPPDDVLVLLVEDHRQVEGVLAQFDTVSVAGRGELFWKLTNELVRHEVAEEIVVYPALRDVPGGDQVAGSRIAEQSEAEEKLAAMERLDAESAEFADQFITLRSAVLAHARAEESTALPLLADHLPSERLVEMGERYQRAKRGAPTHPHPHAPDSPPGNLVLGPVAALVDRIRDAASAA
ncbi:MAG: hemerythrin domain-containing protein [Acidimicrobiales bacterium]